MAVYWVDPYVDAGIGGIHGTTETTTRTGTYAAPFSWADVNGTQSGNYPGVTLADGDEIRIKGLSSLNDFYIDLGSVWYASNYYNFYTASANSTWESEKTAKDQLGFAFALDSDFSNGFMKKNSAGTTVPLHFTGGWSSNTRISLYSSSGSAGFIQNWIRPRHYNSSTASLKIYLIDPDYYVSSETPTGATYPFVKSNVSLKITDGWTSSTARDGVNVIVLEATNMGNTTRNYYFNVNGNNKTYGNWYDILNTHFVFIDTDSNTAYSRPYAYMNSAGGSVYNGTSTTQKYGSFVKADGGYPFYDYTSWYYQGGSSTDSNACNNIEFGMLNSYYAVYSYARYGENHEIRYNNLFSRTSGIGYFNHYNFNNRRLDVIIGSGMSYNGSSGGFINTTTNVMGGDAPYYTFLDSATLFAYNNAESLFYASDKSLTDKITFGTGLITGTSHPERFDTGSTWGPKFVGLSTGMPPYEDDLLITVSDWTQAKGIFYDGRTSTPHDASEINQPLGVLLCNDSDYRNTNSQLLTKTDMYIYTTYGQTSPYLGDINMHFSNNDYDGKPVGLMLSTQRNNSYHYGLLYYNDSAEDNALVIQGNALAYDNDWYTKTIEIPIPKYTTEGIRITANLKVSSNWPNGNFVRLSAYYIHKTNGWTWTTLLTASNPASSYSTYTDVTLDIPNSSLPTKQTNHMKIGIDIQNPYSHEHKLYIKTIEATLV